jgi:hypothetical protein
VNWEASWLAHPVRLAEVFLTSHAAKTAAVFSRSPHALGGEIGGMPTKSKKITLRCNIWQIAVRSNQSLTNFLQSLSHQFSLEENSDDIRATGYR